MDLPASHLPQVTVKTEIQAKKDRSRPVSREDGCFPVITENGGTVHDYETKNPMGRKSIE
jgi:hypothetical protein